MFEGHDGICITTIQRPDLRTACFVETEREGVHVTCRLADDEVTVLDTRPYEECRAGHIPGALSVPLDDLDRRGAMEVQQ